ncbi:MAG TPA: LytTR family DNA-binding domain-containing protein [Cyclobacteriaceae bacterium]|nr:LytTR family DNA-binding domain-containing protein [Cyclobacteriaceae bacterium]
MKCIIVDDEPLAIEILESYVARIDELELKGTFRNAIAAFSFLQQNQVDLIFLDIEMPKLSGIDFLKTLKNSPKVIITTAYRDYAIEGFELEVVDYLLKPISFERFLKSVGKLQRIDMPAAPQASTQDNFIYFKVDKKMVKTKIADILYIESIKDYVKVRTADKEIITQQKISYLDESLPRQQFLRVHRSFIVNLDRIDAYTATDVEISKFKVPIGRNYKADVMKVLSKQVFT